MASIPTTSRYPSALYAWGVVVLLLIIYTISFIDRQILSLMKGFITADMATNVYDPEKRLRIIQDSMRAGKQLLQELSPTEATLFMQMTQIPAMLTSILGLGARFPAFSTVVSNVPGISSRGRGRKSAAPVAV